MPTPEANASSSVAPRNANVTEMVKEEIDSIKAVVSTMTQDQCLDNSHHQANSNNNRSSSVKVGDDLNNSKNNVVSNGVNSVQEFNVDVNHEYSTDSVIVQNRAVDSDSTPTEKVSQASKQLTETSDFSSSENILIDSIDNIDEKRIKSADKIAENMTVITHQNSGENIRDIISNSTNSNKISADSELNNIIKNTKSKINTGNENKLTETRKVRKLIRSENVHECEGDQVEDPIERLNKLRASISSALSEVKGVLKQYSTEQSIDEQNESVASKQSNEDGPVRFRFVRKIRRRSVFSEEDESEITKIPNDVTTLSTIKNNLIEGALNESEGNKKIELNNQDSNDQIANHSDQTNKVMIETVSKVNVYDIPITPSTIIDIEIKETKENLSTGATNVPPSSSSPPKIKNGKTKKIVNKDRRASIATVDVNKTSSDQPHVLLESQRRPSDSGTLIKQAPRIKTKTSEKTKLISNRKTKGSPSSKTKSSTTKPDVLKVSEKAKAITSPKIGSSKTLDIKPSSSVGNKNVSEQNKPSPSANGNEQLLIENQNETVLTSKESKSTEKTFDTNTEAKEPQESSLVQIKTSEVTSPPKITSTANVITSNTSSEAIEVNTLIDLSSTKQSKPENYSVHSGTIQNSAKIIIEDKIPDVSQNQAKNTQVKNDLTINTPEMVVPALERLVSNESTQLLQSKNTSAEVKKIVNSNKQITKPKQLSVSSKTATSDSKTDSIVHTTEVLESKTNSSLPTKTDEQQKMSTEAKQVEIYEPAIVKRETTIQPQSPNPEDKKTSNVVDSFVDETSLCEPDVPIPVNVPKDAVAVKLNLPGQQSVEELQKLDTQGEKEITPPKTLETSPAVPKKKRKAKRKVVIRRIKRKLSKDDTFLHQQEAPAELEICEKEIEEKDLNEEPEEEVSDAPKQPKSCLKNRQFEIGDMVMYAEHYKKTQVRWKKAVVTERITSISYKLNIDGDERPAHISYIKKFTDRKVNFGGKEYLEIDYAQIEEDEEKERNYSIWNLV